MQEANNLVSVIIPTYNRCALLRRALESVQAQTHAELEILVVDDGSTDDTEDMVRALDDERIQFFPSKLNGGGGMARWRGAEAATGSYLAYLDSDDYWLPEKIDRQLAALRASGFAEGVVVNPPLVEREGQRYVVAQPALGPDQHVADYIYCSGFTLQTSCFFLPAALGKRVRFNPELGVNQDTDYMLRLQQSGARFVYLDENLHVQDVDPRADRITGNKARLAESMEWFARSSGDWPRRARRGFYFVDASLRCARQGKRLRGLWYLLRGLDGNRPVREVIRYALMILGYGEMPRPVRRLRRSSQSVDDV